MAADDVGLQYILEFFKDSTGFLVDVGAHDGVEVGSMTRDLVLAGWTGMFIEPLPKAFILLEKAYGSNPDMICVQSACSDDCGIAELYPCDGVSTLEPSWRDACDGWWKHIKYGDPIVVPKITLSALIEKHGIKQIDYLQIDTEGHDMKVLLGMDWRIKPRLICVETLDMVNPGRKDEKGVFTPPEDVDTFLIGQGYSLALATIGGNGIYVRATND